MEFITDLTICIDCVQAANGHTSADTGDKQTDRFHKEQTRLWPNHFFTLSSNEDDTEFLSDVPCEGCGTPLAGTRYPATAAPTMPLAR